ncbi:MAG: hypothetical protein P8178_12010 [Candidatus Thiodiazotropha sp.]
MTRLIGKLATLAILFGVVGTSIGLWDIVRKSGINKEALPLQARDLHDFDGGLRYTRIEGGRLDLSNSCEYRLDTLGRDGKTASRYFTPVLNSENSHLAYIIGTEVQPTRNDMLIQADYTGLLQSRSELPGSIRMQYVEKFPNARLLYLDTTFRPQPVIERLTELRIHLGLILAGLTVRLVLSKADKRERFAPRETEKPA